MNQDKRLNDKGFSLMELLVCLAISAIVILAAYSLVMVGSKQYETNRKNSKLQNEMKYTLNLLRENIIAGDQKNTVISYSDNGNTIALHMNMGIARDRIIYYHNDVLTGKQYLCIYKDGETLGASMETHLITKYVTDFSVQFVEADGNAVAIPSGVLDANGNGNVPAYTNLVKVSLKMDYKDKTDTSEIVYQIRNKS